MKTSVQICLKTYSEGYINFDEVAKGGIKDDVANFKNHFGKNSINDIIVDSPKTPFIDVMTDAIKRGGLLTIRGQCRNGDFIEIRDSKTATSGFEIISKKIYTS